MELTAAELQRVLELVDTYADLRLDAIDGATIAVAERLGLTTVATLDHRDFATVRPAHCEALTLLPAGRQLDESWSARYRWLACSFPESLSPVLCAASTTVRARSSVLGIRWL